MQSDKNTLYNRFFLEKGFENEENIIMDSNVNVEYINNCNFFTRRMPEGSS